MADRDTRTVKSANRVLEILEYFAGARRTATVMDMSRDLGYPQSSTSELLRCLTRSGYLHYNRFRRTYSPTARVALLGTGIESSLIQPGPILSAVDDVASLTGETVVLSTASNYAVRHLHVVVGAHDRAVETHVGDTASLLRSAQGRLLLASYRLDHIRSALHRLNAEEADPEPCSRVVDSIDDLIRLRDRGWLVQHDTDGQGAVAVSLKCRKGMDRLVMSIIGTSDVIMAREQELRDLLLDRRDRLNASILPVEAPRRTSTAYGAGSIEQRDAA